jgi:UDP-N-acetyl-D-mannosaminuronate dehydrogenase
MKNIVIQGLGFVGSAMAVAIASSLDRNGKSLFHVIGVDRKNQLGLERIKSINSGRFPFNTNDDKLTSELKKSIERGNLKATNDTNVYATADIVLVSINCDLVNENGQDKIALSAFINSICEIAKNISENTLVIIESTVPPGTCEKIVYPLFEEMFNKRKLNINKFYLAHSYERVMPGDAYFDSIVNYWRVYAGIDEEDAALMPISHYAKLKVNFE